MFYMIVALALVRQLTFAVVHPVYVYYYCVTNVVGWLLVCKTYGFEIIYNYRFV